MLRAWRKPETIIVNEAWWNPMARHADIVLPCTSTLERDDIAGGLFDAYLFASRRVVEPYREARDDFAIFRGNRARARRGVGIAPKVAMPATGCATSTT